MNNTDIKRIVLVGLRCTGKTSVGKLLAQKLGWEFVDADEELVREQKRTIADIFASDGEGEFRRLEKDVLAALCKNENTVIATGGGAVLDRDNIEVMRRDAFVVHLTAPVDILVERMGRDPITGCQRPALTDLDEKKEMEITAEKRAPLYNRASDMEVDTSEFNLEAIAERIISAL